MSNLSIQRATCTADWQRARDFVNAHHSYIKWADRPARKRYWLLFEGGGLCGVFGLASAWTHPKAIKTEMQASGVTFNEVANNIVYCLAGVESKNAGSQFLALLRRDAKMWWKEQYGDDLKLLQTFILPPRNGAVYLADNWRLLGETSGNSFKTETLTAEEYTNLADRKGIQTKVLRGQVRYIKRTPNTTERKLILVRKP